MENRYEPGQNIESKGFPRSQRALRKAPLAAVRLLDALCVQLGDRSDVRIKNAVTVAEL